jgi:SAM-dependent methyltransferase
MNTPYDAQSDFDRYYYASGCGLPYQRDEHWLSFFDGIGERIASDIAPGSVLDAGCAWGFLVENLRQRNIDAYGIDISEFAISNIHPSIQSYCKVGSIVDPFPRRYDLIVCIEVLEHMQPAEAEKAVENFCAHTDDVLFSSTPFDYKETTHYNVRPPEYWAELFARQGFFRDIDFDASFLTPWATRFRKKQEPIVRLVSDYERKFFLLWKENTDLRTLAEEMRRELALKIGATNRLQEIENSRSWLFMQKLIRQRERWIPYGSRQERILQKIHLIK